MIWSISPMKKEGSFSPVQPICAQTWPKTPLIPDHIMHFWHNVHIFYWFSSHVMILCWVLTRPQPQALHWFTYYTVCVTLLTLRNDNHWLIVFEQWFRRKGLQGIPLVASGSWRLSMFVHYLQLNSAVQRQTAVTAYFTSKQLLLFVFARPCKSSKDKQQ